nr:hypothetical protein [Holospora curviuscula]
MPYTGFGPSYQAFVSSRLFPVRFWKGMPSCTLAGNPHHRIDKFLVIVLPARPESPSFPGKLFLFLPIGLLVFLAILSPIVAK